MLYTGYYHSPLGRLLLAADEIGLTGLWFERQRYFAQGLAPVHTDEETPILAQTRRWLDLYFSGSVPDFTPPLHPIGSDFRQEVWALLLQIPYGKTTTYGALANQLAEKHGQRRMSAQAVGGAVGHNAISIIIPCHRVVGADGSLTGYAGGLDTKARLLAVEGIPIAETRRAYGLICELYMSDIYKILFTHCPFPRIIGDADEVEEWKSMQYTELTRKELQREYTRLTQRYSSYMREPMELDMRAEDPLLGRCENRRAAKHFGTVLGKELSDTGAARPTPAEDAVAALCTMPGCANRTVELCRRAGVLFDAVDHSTVLARIIPFDAKSEQLTHAASLFAISARLAALESLRGTLLRT